jgi:ribosome-binding protein aMBF1 (putative translation factor)
MKQRLPAFVCLSCLQGSATTVNLDGKIITVCEQTAPNHFFNSCLVAEKRLVKLYA